MEYHTLYLVLFPPLVDRSWQKMSLQFTTCLYSTFLKFTFPVYKINQKFSTNFDCYSIV